MIDKLGVVERMGQEGGRGRERPEQPESGLRLRAIVEFGARMNSSQDSGLAQSYHLCSQSSLIDPLLLLSPHIHEGDHGGAEETRPHRMTQLAESN